MSGARELREDTTVSLWRCCKPEMLPNLCKDDGNVQIPILQATDVQESYRVCPFFTCKSNCSSLVIWM